MNIMIVCSGNTCRSPMAEALMDEAIDRSSGLHGDVKVESSGTFACEGADATPEAQRVMEEMGLSLKRHEARQFTRELADDADLILAVAKEQIEQMEVIAPEDTDKMHTLVGYAVGVLGDPPGTEYDIMDPFDEGIEEYRACAEQLNDAVIRLVHRLEQDFEDEDE